jgi:diguanylate cyclase (GGDEF)-like protein
MRLRFWIGLSAVLLIAAGSVLAAFLVYAQDDNNFHQMQREEAARAARQTASLAALSVGQLSSAAAFFQAEGNLRQHDFNVVGRSLLHEGVLSGTAYVARVPASRRAHFERAHHMEIVDRGPSGLRRAGRRAVYYPLTYVISEEGPVRAIGIDLGAETERERFLHRARDTGKAAATPVIPLIIGGEGINVYRAVFRDGAPIATRAERRRALIGYAAGSFRVGDLAATAIGSLAGSSDVQLRTGQKRVAGVPGRLDDAAIAPIQIADTTWLLVVRDPNRPEIVLPVLLAGVGLALAALLGVLIFVWSRNERMQELQLQAGQDSLTGLKNRRRFEEDLRTVTARGRRERTTGALLMIDLDHFKRINDTYGHPAGDRLIEEIAGVLRRRTRESDVLARLGGDEFAVVLPRSGIGEARMVAEAIVEAIRDHRPVDEDVEPVTASIGVAMFGDDPRISQATLSSQADTAMYAAKDGGRDGVRVFDRGAISEDARGAR